MPQTHHRDRFTGQTQPATSPRVLVVYATRYGSTKGIAERIAATLRDAGIRVRVTSASAAAGVAAYDAIVFGGAVFDQRWLPEGDAFTRDNLAVLAQRPVWLFSVGTFGDRKPIIGPLMRREPKGIGALCSAIRPRDYRVFAGVIEREHWPFASRLLYHALGGRLGDRRDWRDIDDWARTIATALTAMGRPMPVEQRRAHQGLMCDPATGRP